MRIVISGATSMIGAALTNKLLENNHEVIAVVRPNSKKTKALDNNPKLSIVECNMEDYADLNNLIKGKVDVAVSTAWNGTRGAYRNNKELQEENYKNSISFLRAMLSKGCLKFLTAGSQAEYGLWTKKEKLKEDVVPNPNTEYGKYKLNFYQYAKDCCSDNGCKLIEPRFFSLYGPKDYEGTLVISTLEKMLKNEPCELTECIQLWDFLYIDDAIDGLVKLVEDDVPEGIYNFGSGYSAPLKEFIEEMKEITNSDSELRYGFIPYPATGIVDVNPDVSKLMKCGWEYKTSFQKGVMKIVSYLENVKRIRGGVTRSLILNAISPKLNWRCVA